MSQVTTDEYLKKIVGKGLDPVPDDENTRLFRDAVQKKSDSRLMIAFFKDSESKAPVTFLFSSLAPVRPLYNDKDVPAIAILYEMQGDETFVRSTDLPKYALKFEPGARLVRHVVPSILRYPITDSKISS